MTENEVPTIGALAAALAKAHAAFPPVVKDKHVTITTKTGGKYEFDYAPLDSILAATRGPLSANGLALVQMLDAGGLVTALYHESGAVISGRVEIPHTEDIKAYGSAITYLRRYAIQAMLGIAAEDDDDGSRATGDTIAAPSAKHVEHGSDGSLMGIAQVGDKASSDFLVRKTPDGYALGFRLRGDKGGILVECRDALAEQLFAFKEATVGNRVTVWGTITERAFTPKGKPEVRYQVLAADRVRVPEVGDLPTDTTTDPVGAPEPSSGLVEAPSVPLFSDEEQAAIDADLDRVLGVTA